MRLIPALLGATAALALASGVSAQETRGDSGHLNILYWQAVSILNPYLSGGTKDVEASSLVLEPLARYDQDANLVPWLAAEIPSVENGGVAEDYTSITWKLRDDIVWSDGTPLTAKDVVFTWEYCTADGTGCAQEGKFEGITAVEALDEHTVRITFAQPTYFPWVAFVGAQSPILQKAQFQNCVGAAAATCTEANTRPIGTGPFVVTEFLANDVVSFAANENYRDPNKPHFATVTFKGGGDAAAAARAVLETGEFDYAWNLQLAPDVLQSMQAAGQGQVVSAFGTLVERIEVNLTDPSPSLPEGERSTLAHPHPFLTIPEVREAMSLAIDRQTLVDVGYGEAGRPTCNLVPAPEYYASDDSECATTFDLERAKALLEQAGFTDTDGDGVRENADGVRLSVLFQTSTNAVRQDFQALIKSWWEEIGFEVELRNIDAAVYFGGDAGSPDTIEKFYADVEMYANNFEGTDPTSYLAAYTCDKIPSPETQWQGQNINRVCDPAYEEMLAQFQATGDQEERSRLARAMNEYLTLDNHIVIALVDRGRVSGHANSLGGVVLNTWDSELWNIADWYRIAQ
ncbi:ABC-type dipeptide transport system, periplasmic component [Rubellimicrobium thermophilum DSM 16684]|uniref:ABC-type dipeptide transport system, periplasmic component n=1 Tax=Rubellimicrobium thermophilum DSM 16684 TaxID=1123069 RepID=S9R311_9RHOB|nr:peptide ABC transporter substrate-binding protein [Rubellimicrobium thermophilum]EPX86368.1 ABC-type dipeptide transport system, periplasmic component [Rubellimicrobium thermophilum DSM 16684]